MNNKNIVNIKLKYINNINDYSYMFDNFIDLLLLKKIEEWNTSNVKNISWMFHDCFSLIKFPDISKWNTSNVNDMSEN